VFTCCGEAKNKKEQTTPESASSSIVSIELGLASKKESQRKSKLKAKEKRSKERKERKERKETRKKEAENIKKAKEEQRRKEQTKELKKKQTKEQKKEQIREQKEEEGHTKEEGHKKKKQKKKIKNEIKNETKDSSERRGLDVAAFEEARRQELLRRANLSSVKIKGWVELTLEEENNKVIYVHLATGEISDTRPKNWVKHLAQRFS
jgi:hypothetical protein